MATTPIPFRFRWGIISTGNVAACFVKDLGIDPKTRDAHDVLHKVVAVGSRSIQNAQAFVDKYANGDKKTIKIYGTYEEVYADKDVDAVYIGTPHTCHFLNALCALKAKKNVLCEKPVTTSVVELCFLLEVAKENGVFFMEAISTCFQPLTREVKRLAESGILGAPVMLHADLSCDFDVHNLPKTHRILNPELGGGALLDLGPYVIFWALLALYENPANNSRAPNTISASRLKTLPTAVDSNTAFTLAFCPPDGSDTGLSTLAVLSCSITLSALNPGVIIRFEHGNIVIAAPIYCPKAFTVQHFGREAGSRGTVVKEETRRFEYVGGGWHWQADEVARCVREGRKQSLVWGHLKSLLEMQILDDVRSIWQAAERVKQEQLEGGEQKMKPEQKRKFNPIEDGRTAREEGRQPVASGHDKDKVVAVEQSDGIEQLLELPQRPLKRKEREETGTRLRPAKGKCDRCMSFRNPPRCEIDEGRKKCRKCDNDKHACYWGGISMDGNRPRIADKAVLANRTDDQEVVVARPSLRTPNAIPGLFGYLSQEKGKPRAPQKR